MAAITIDLAPLLSRAGSDWCVSKTRGGASQRALINLTLLEFKAQIRLEYLILIERIDTDVAEAPYPNMRATGSLYFERMAARLNAEPVT